MRGLRIAVYHNLPTGGAKRTLHDMVRRLSRNHHLDCFTLSCSSREFCDLRPYVQNMHVYGFQPAPLLRSPLGRANSLLRLGDITRLARLSRHIARDIDAGNYDVAFVHPSQYTQSPTLLRFLRIPSLYYCQEPLRRLYEPSAHHTSRQPERWRAILDRLDPAQALYDGVLRHADLANVRAATSVLANSRFTAQNVNRIYGIESEVCYHGVDVAQFAPLGLKRENMVLSVGALVPIKGHDFVVRSVGLIPASIRPGLTIVSNHASPEERTHVEQIARQCGVELSIRLMASDTELVALYNQARATAYAPHLEPFGLVPLESMACGTPVVGVREGGVAETILDGETGFLVERDVQLFAQALQTMCAHPDLATQYGMRGRSYVEERWTWDHRLRTLEQYLSETARAGKMYIRTAEIKERAGA